MASAEIATESHVLDLSTSLFFSVIVVDPGIVRGLWGSIPGTGEGAWMWFGAPL